MDDAENAPGSGPDAAEQQAPAAGYQPAVGPGEGPGPGPWQGPAPVQRSPPQRPPVAVQPPSGDPSLLVGERAYDADVPR